MAKLTPSKSGGRNRFDIQTLWGSKTITATRVVHNPLGMATRVETKHYGAFRRNDFGGFSHINPSSPPGLDYGTSYESDDYYDYDDYSETASQTDLPQIIGIGILIWLSGFLAVLAVGTKIYHSLPMDDLILTPIKLLVGTFTLLWVYPVIPILLSYLFDRLLKNR